jgi:hypothetical protein
LHSSHSLVTLATRLTLVHPKRTQHSGLSQLAHRYGEESKTTVDGDLRYCPISKDMCRLLHLAEGDQAVLVWVVSNSCHLWTWYINLMCSQIAMGYIKDPAAIAAASTAHGRGLLTMAVANTK